MITFEKIKWRNLLSTGNAWTEVDLNRSTTTLIVGKNGEGKSTILDALMFSLSVSYTHLTLPTKA